MLRWSSGGNLRAAVLGLLVVMVAVPGRTSRAHPDIDDQLRGLERDTGACDATAHLRRGNLHRLRREWEQAKAAYESAATCGLDKAELDLARGDLALAMGSAAEACVYLDRHVALRPESP